MFASEHSSFFLYLLLKTDFSTLKFGTAYPVTKLLLYSGFTISEHKLTLPYPPDHRLYMQTSLFHTHSHTPKKGARDFPHLLPGTFSSDENKIKIK